MLSSGFSKSHIFVVFKLINPITVVFCIFFELSDQFGWQSPLPVHHFGWWTLITEAISAGYSKVAAKIAGGTFPPFPSFWSPAHNLHLHPYFTFTL